MKLSKFKTYGKKIKYIAILILLILAIISIKTLTIKQDNQRKRDFISEKLETITELATARYDYSNVISIKNNLTFKNYNIPFTEKSFVIKYTGHITAGVDLSHSTFTLDNNKLTITIEPCSILNNTVDEDEIFIFDEKTSIFNKLTMEDMLEEILLDKEKTEKALLEDGFLNQVTVDTIELLKNLFKESGFKEVIVKIATK